MKKHPLLILFLLLFSFYSFSQGCNNEDFELGSSPVSSTVAVTLPNALSGWTINSGFNSGTVTSCNIYSCCPSNPNPTQIISTTSLSGMVDPNIGPSYPISSVYCPYSSAWTPTLIANSGGGYGNAFCKLNDDVPNSGIQKIGKQINVTTFNALFALSILPVIQNSSHACCSQPSIKVWLRNSMFCPTTGTIIPSPQLSIFSSTACSSSLGGFIPCPSNSLFSYRPWTTYVFDLTSYIGYCIDFELAVADCAFGDHAAYAYFDAQCIPFDFVANTGPYCPAGPNVYSTCGLNSSFVSVPPNMGPFLWNGPSGWPYNGATTSTVNLTLPGVYTVSCNPMGVTTPIVRTFTVISTPPASATLTSSQSTACAGGNTIALTGSPSGGTYTGSFVTGNTFNPSSTGNYSVSYTYTDSNGCSATDTKSINVITCPTGINNITASNFNAELYPQPTKDIVNINLINSFNKNIEARIIDLTGKEIEKKELEVSQGKTQFSISHLPNGIYILQLKNSQGQVAVKRLVVSK
jgi:hypothetical protein